MIQPEDISRERFIDSPISNPTAMIRREVLEEYGGYRDTTWAEDYDLWLRLLHDGNKLGKVSEPLLDWFDWDDRSTRKLPRYSLENFQRAKAHFLAKLKPVQDLGVSICGAGPLGKTMAGLLRHEKITVHSFFEVNERRIGNRIADVPVYSSNELDRAKGTILLSSVGLRGARDQVRAVAQDAEFTEGKDFFCVA